MEIVFVTGNAYKLKLANHMLNKYNITVIGTSEKISEIQAGTTEEVVIHKAKEAFSKLQTPVIVMDSGLFIKSLHGFPGVYTAYVQKTLGEDGLIKLVGHKDNCAELKQVICFNDGNVCKTFSSGSRGKIIKEKKGSNGYFFDLIFVPDKLGRTIAQLTDKEKAEVWGDAWDKLGTWLNAYLKGGR